MNKRLYRLPANGKFGGVAAGLADFLEVDVTLVRLVLLAMILFTGIFPGLLFYIIAIAIMPVKGESNGQEHKT